MTTAASDPLLEAAGEGGHARELLRDPGLRALFTASTTARLANEASRVAVVLLVLDRGGSASLAGGLVAALSLPSLVTGPLLGAWLDRTPHRRLVFLANQVLLAGCLVGLLAAAGHAPGAVVLLLGLLAGTTSPVLTGGFTGLIAPLVPAALLRRAYGAEGASYNVAAVAGPAAAGVLADLAGAPVSVAFTAAVSGLALVAVLRVPMPAPAPAARPGLLREVSDGVAHLLRTPALRAVTVATTCSFAGMGALPVAFPLLVRTLGAPVGYGGVLFATFALGALGGSLVVAARHSPTPPLRVALRGVAGLAVVFGAVAVAPSLWVAVPLVLLAGAVEGPVLASTLTVREQHTPAAMRTQVVTTAASLKFGAYAAGSALTGVVAHAAGARWGLSVCALAQVLGLVLAVADLRHSR